MSADVKILAAVAVITVTVLLAAGVFLTLHWTPTVGIGS